MHIQFLLLLLLQMIVFFLFCCCSKFLFQSFECAYIELYLNLGFTRKKDRQYYQYFSRYIFFLLLMLLTNNASYRNIGNYEFAHLSIFLTLQKMSYSEIKLCFFQIHFIFLEWDFFSMSASIRCTRAYTQCNTMLDIDSCTKRRQRN